MTSLNVAIVGAGPGGLALANILYQISKSPSISNHLSFRVFELEASKDARSQGGMLDVHRSSGQQSLKKAGVIEDFKRHMRIDATELRIRDNTGYAHLQYSEEEKGGPGEKGEVADVERPEIDRKELKEILLEKLPVKAVAWGKKLVSLSKSKDNASKLDLHFEDGSSEHGFDLVVGADGTWSKVRSGAEILAGHEPHKPPYSGVICVESTISDAQKRHPNLVEFNGKGSCFAASRTSGVFSQNNGDGSLRTYYMFNEKEDWKVGDGSNRHSRLVSKGPFVEEYMAEWSQESKELMLKHDTADLLVRPLYEYPPGHSWKSPIPGITLLGDAAHVMTPFAGIGVNLALTDALDLSVAIEEIISGSKSIAEALDAFEEKMYQRSSEGCALTYHNRIAWIGKREEDGTVIQNEGIEKIVSRYKGQGYTQPELKK